MNMNNLISMDHLTLLSGAGSVSLLLIFKPMASVLIAPSVLCTARATIAERASIIIRKHAAKGSATVFVTQVPRR